jgi:hypothetical protein
MVESDRFPPFAVDAGGSEEVVDRQRPLGMRDRTWRAARHYAVEHETSAKTLLERALRRYLDDPVFADRVRASVVVDAEYRNLRVRLDDDLWQEFAARVRGENGPVWATADAALAAELGVDND